MIATPAHVCHVDNKFIKNVLHSINCRLATTSYRDLQNRKFGFNFLIKNREEYPKLIEYKNILISLLNCNDCLNDAFNINDILYAIKNELNEL